MFPRKDIDGYTIWAGFNPSVLNHTTPKDQYVSKPFYFGGANIRAYIKPNVVATKK